METIRLIGRDSRLSLLQLEKVKQKIEASFPSMKIQVITRSSRGDALQDVPLHTMEGSDFFTEDIFTALSNREADIAVHSLKDMSGEHFFGSNRFAVVDRDDVRDIAIFRKGTEEKIINGETLVIGTCSPRREEMAIEFLQKALPQLHDIIRIETKSIRGNVDTRLRKLASGEYDGIILAMAGLNRLLESEKDSLQVRSLLKDKKLMLLPLVECVPAPCQGAIVAEADPGNHLAVEVLNAINDSILKEDCILEKQVAMQYGAGCLQRFGVTIVRLGGDDFLYAAGTDCSGNKFSKWIGLPETSTKGKRIFNSADHMGSFFEYGYYKEDLVIDEEVVYISNYKAVHRESLIELLKEKRTWAAGTKTWFELAKKGIWVEGCADAFGLEYLSKVWATPVFSISKEKVAVITNEQSAKTWLLKDWKTYSTYRLIERSSADIKKQITRADIIFWTSFQQYMQYKNSVKRTAIHFCSYGETALQLKEAGIVPVVFPNIKAFQQWKKTSTRSLSAA